MVPLCTPYQQHCTKFYVQITGRSYATHRPGAAQPGGGPASAPPGPCPTSTATPTSPLSRHQPPPPTAANTARPSACSAGRGGAPTPPRDRCGPSCAPPARPSLAQPHCPTLRPSQPSRQHRGSSTSRRRSLERAAKAARRAPHGGHAGHRRSAPSAPPRLAVGRVLEFSSSMNWTVAASRAISSSKAGEAPARNTHRARTNVRCGSEHAGRVRSAGRVQAAARVREMNCAPQTKKNSRCRAPPLLGQLNLATPLICARHRLRTRQVGRSWVSKEHGQQQRDRAGRGGAREGMAGSVGSAREQRAPRAELVPSSHFWRRMAALACDGLFLWRGGMTLSRWAGDPSRLPPLGRSRWVS